MTKEGKEVRPEDGLSPTQRILIEYIDRIYEISSDERLPEDISQSLILSALKLSTGLMELSKGREKETKEA